MAVLPRPALPKLLLVPLLSLTLLLPACADHVALDVSPCPCADGYVCCDSGVCAQDQASCASATRALSSSVQGTWSGYFESFDVDDDALRISLSVDGDGNLSGTAVIGTGPPVAPATNPDLPWPDPEFQVTPPSTPLPSIRSLSYFQSPSTTYISGFVYPLRNLRWEQHRLRFTLDSLEPWQPWCHLQTSFDVGSGQFASTPTEDASIDVAGNCAALTTPPTPTPCFKFVLGWLYCSCNADGCAANLDADLAAVETHTGYSSTFDLAIRDSIGDGTSYVSFHGGFNVRLTKQQ